VETDAIASGNESDGLFADRSMGEGRSIERRWSLPVRPVCGLVSRAASRQGQFLLS
jgi:hypothetical protein